MALPDEALEFLKLLSSSLSFSMLALIASESHSRILRQTLFSTIVIKYSILNYFPNLLIKMKRAKRTVIEKPNLFNDEALPASEAFSQLSIS